MTECWRAYYTEGRQFYSDECDWSDLPGTGALVFVEKVSERYKKRVSGGDWYWIEDGRIQASDTIWGGHVDPPAHVDTALLKRGGAVDDTTFATVQERAKADFR